MWFQTNLRIIGTIKRSIQRHREHQRWIRQEYDYFQKKDLSRLVLKAIYIEAPEIAEEIRYGYRRSEGSDERAEEDFLKTDQPYFPLNRDYHYRRALRVTEKLFRPSRRLRPISFPDLRYYPWTLNTSAEVPFTNSKKWIDHVRRKQAEGDIENGAITFHNLYNEIFDINRTLIHRIKYGMQPFWNTETREPLPYLWHSLHTRAHLVKANKPDKNRSVFGVSKLLLMAENMFIWPLQKEYLNANVKSPMLWGFETIRGGWYKLVRELSKDGYRNSFISADWSGFDHKALFDIIDDVHSMWRSWFDFDGYEPTNVYPHSTTEAWKIENLWRWMCNAIKFTPILGQSGKLYQWTFNGIASGYQQTQLIDSFVNCIMLLTCLSTLGINIEDKRFRIFVQGDDSLIAFDEMTFHFDKSFLTRLEVEAKRRFNADLSADKTSAGEHLDHVEVLSYGNKSGVAYRDEKELLAHLLYPERTRDLGATASSAVGIATAAMGSSQRLYNVCKNVFDFITTQLEVEPRARPFIWLGKEDQTVDLTQFPTFAQTFAQNFDLRERSDSEKNKLWPTSPVGVTDLTPDGFYFLNE